MPKRSSKQPTAKDINQLAVGIVEAATRNQTSESAPEKNPAAVALGRLGGKKGGPARAAALSAAKRKAIAAKAAAARWSKGAEQPRSSARRRRSPESP